MAKNLGRSVSTTLDGLGYAFDKVVFQKDKPILDSELNLAQELQEILTQKSTGHLPSGWLSYRPYYTSPELENAFYTQDPTGAKPEVALVNGWPVYVTNTDTPLKHINQISLTDAELRSGSRVDGVFLEVWRSLISPESGSTEDDVFKPQPLTKVSDIHGITMLDENFGYAVGDSAVILRTTDGGVSWNSVDSPVNANFRKVKFYNSSIGYAIGEKGYVIKTLDGGSSWFVVSTPTEENLNDIYVIDDQRVCVVGNSGTVLLAVDGENFSNITEISSTTDNLRGVFFHDIAIGWIVGDNGVLLITKDGGLTWTRHTVVNLRTSDTVTENLLSVAFYNLNDGLIVGSNGTILRTSDSGYTWTSMSDRILVDGVYKSLSEIYPTKSLNLNKVFIMEEFPIKLIIGVYPDSKNYFKNLTYKVSPESYPGALVLEYTGVQDNINYINVLNLSNYATAEQLRNAVNDIRSPYLASDASLPNVDREKIRVFEASIEQEPFGQPSDFKPTAGAFSSLVPAELSFSVEDKAWIAGDDGTVLVTSNSGSKWELQNIGTGLTLYDVNYTSTTNGWFVSAEGTIVFQSESSSEIQETDLNSQAIGRIFPEGNILSDAEDYLVDNIIDPQVNVETTKRVQIQYRVRIVDGVDPFNFPESGLGHRFVYSLGPNADSNSSGNFPFVNMGDENGDYGLWRAKCRNTVDGYSWAVPMFFVTRRNSGAFDVNNNINGSTYFELNAIRPGGLTYEEVVQEDVIDVRRQININSYSHLLQKNLDKVFKNNQRTNISDKDQKGLQYGTSILAVDTYNGPNEINELVRGGVNSSAVIRDIIRTLDPNTSITEAELTFGPLDNALFHNDPAFYSAFVVRDGTVTEEPVQGTWEGLGTNTVKFNLADNFTPEGGTLEGIEYQFTSTYIDYSATGLSRVPQKPISIRYLPDPTNISSSMYFNGINSRQPEETYETFTEVISGYPDYVNIKSASVIPNNVDDRALYESTATSDVDSLDLQRSLRQYRGQQFVGSLVEYHYFLRTETATTTLRIPKNLNGYSVFGARYVKSVTGTEYKISSNFAANQSMRDRETVDNSVITDNVLVYLDEAFIIPADTIVEVVLEVTIPDDVFSGTPVLQNPPGTPILTSDLIDITVQNRGENQEALRTPFTANYNVASKGIGGQYTAMLYPIVFTNTQNQFQIDLTNSNVPGLDNGTILGLSSYQTKESDTQMYLWFQSVDPEANYFTTLPVASVDGLGSSIITINMAPDRSVTAGNVLVPILVKLNTLPDLADASRAHTFYQFIPYQTVNNLPNELKVEIVSVPDFVYVSNLGTGASSLVNGEPYEIPIEHIAVNDSSVINDNMFSNVDDLDFASFSIDTGFVKLPAIIANSVGDDLILSSPNNIGDRLGRTFYSEVSDQVFFQAEGLTISTPRKVFVPMLARVRTAVTSPVLRGELVLLVFSKVYKARIENKTGFFDDPDVEYAPGYVEFADTAVSVYRLNNKPLVRK